MALQEYPPAPQPGKIDPSKTTSYSIGPSTHGGTSTKEETPELAGKRKEWERSEDERLAKMEGTKGDQPITPRLVAATVDDTNAQGEESTSAPAKDDLDSLMSAPASPLSDKEQEFQAYLDKLPPAPGGQATPPVQPQGDAIDQALTGAQQPAPPVPAPGPQPPAPGGAPDPFDQQTAPTGPPSAQMFATMGGKPVTPLAPAPQVHETPKTDTGTLGPGEVANLQDRLAHSRAQEEARQQKELMQSQAEIRQWRQQAMQSYSQQMQQAQDRYEKDRHITTYMEDKSWPQRILLGFAVGLGTYGSGAGPRIFSQYMQQDFEAKKELAAQDLERMKELGASRGQIDQAAEKMTADILARQSAQLTLLDKQGQVLLSRFAPASQKFQQSIADERAKVDKMKMDAATNVGIRSVDRGWSKDATKITEVEGKNDSMRAQPTPGAMEEFVRAKLNARHADTLADYEKTGDLPTGDEMNQILRNEHAIIAQNTKEVHGGVGSVKAGDFLRWVGAMPTNIYPEEMNERKKEATRILLEQAHALFAKRWTPGSISQPEAYEHGMAPLLPQPGDSREQVHNKVNELREYAHEVASEMEASKAGYAERKYEGQTKAGAQASPQASSSSSRSEALAWAKAHPRDPRSIAIQKKVAAEMAGGR